MHTIGMIEADTKLTQLCEEVYLTKKPIVLTKRGRPFVRIEPLSATPQPPSAIWDRRNTFITQHGEWAVDFDLPPRETPQIDENPLGSDV